MPTSKQFNLIISDFIWLPHLFLWFNSSWILFKSPFDEKLSKITDNSPFFTLLSLSLKFFGVLSYFSSFAITLSGVTDDSSFNLKSFKYSPSKINSPFLLNFFPLPLLFPLIYSVSNIISLLSLNILSFPFHLFPLD